MWQGANEGFREYNQRFPLALFFSCRRLRVLVANERARAVVRRPATTTFMDDQTHPGVCLFVPTFASEPVCGRPLQLFVCLSLSHEFDIFSRAF